MKSESEVAFVPGRISSLIEGAKLGSAFLVPKRGEMVTSVKVSEVFLASDQWENLTAAIFVQVHDKH